MRAYRDIFTHFTTFPLSTSLWHSLTGRVPLLQLFMINGITQFTTHYTQTQSITTEAQVKQQEGTLSLLVKQDWFPIMMMLSLLYSLEAYENQNPALLLKIPTYLLARTTCQRLTTHFFSSGEKTFKQIGENKSQLKNIRKRTHKTQTQQLSNQGAAIAVSAVDLWLR